MALLDRARSIITFNYQHGETTDPIPFGAGLTSQIIRTGEALILNSDVSRRSKEMGATVVGEESLSYLGVPIVVEGQSEGSPATRPSTPQCSMHSIPPMQRAPRNCATSHVADNGALLLVVDDNRVNRLLLARHLEAPGHRVELAENGNHRLPTKPSSC